MSLGNLLIILLIVMIFFGAGKLPRVMGDLGKGIRNFRDGLSPDDDKQKSVIEDHSSDSKNS